MLTLLGTATFNHDHDLSLTSTKVLLLSKAEIRTLASLPPCHSGVSHERSVQFAQRNLINKHDPGSDRVHHHDVIEFCVLETKTLSDLCPSHNVSVNIVVHTFVQRLFVKYQHAGGKYINTIKTCTRWQSLPCPVVTKLLFEPSS